VQAAYSVIAPLYPLLHRVFPDHVTTTATLGRAMIQVAVTGYPKHVLCSADFNRLAATT
jgi:hypothetical protein